MKKCTTLLFAILLSLTTCYSQYFLVSIDQKIALSDCIVEGEVINQSTFKDRVDGYIYTDNKIKLSKILSGENHVFSDTISILTRGGVFEGVTETWTHLLHLNIGEYGVFFLNSSEQINSYTTFSGAQGFIRFTDHGIRGFSARDVMTTYKNVKKEVYQKISKSTKHNIKSISLYNEDVDNCLKVSLVPVINNSIEEIIDLNFDLTLAMEEESRYLKSIQFRFRYDTDVLGSNIILNNILSIDLSDDIDEEHYLLDVSDLQEDVVEINLNTTGPSPILLDQFYQSILRFQLDASNLGAIPNFELLNQGFRESIRLINPNTNEEETPDCITTEFPLLERTCPVITSFSPDSVAAGVLGLAINNVPGEITIRGSGFGSPNPGYIKPHESDVSFYDPDGGYFKAGELEYISWSDTEIRMNVPTRSKTVRPSSPGTQDLSLGASTNKIKLFTKNFFNSNDTCTVFSQDSLYVHFGMFNDPHIESFQNIETCSSVFNSFDAVGGERRNLINRNNFGGYNFYIDSLYSNPTMHDSVVNQIIQGLDFYRCGYKFNFSQEFTPVANMIKRMSLDFGTLGTTLMAANSNSQECDPTNQADNPIFSFRININESVLDEQVVLDSLGNSTNTIFKFSFTDTFQPDTTFIDNNGFEIKLRDFRKIFLHEMGHVLQLRHTNNPNDLMAAGSINTSTRNVNANDILGIEHAYLLSKAGTCSHTGMIDWPVCLTSTHNNLQSVENLIISPNPTSTILQFTPSISKGKFVIYDLLSTKVWEENFAFQKQKISVELPSRIQASTYILVVKDTKGNIVQAGKFIKIN